MTDIVSFRIKNQILAASAVFLLIHESCAGAERAQATPLISALVVFIILIPFYLIGFLGAGDVKLLMISAMYTGLTELCGILTVTVASSALIVSVISIVRKTPLSKTEYPFAFALFLGALPRWTGLG